MGEYREQLFEAKKKQKEAGNVEGKTSDSKNEPVKVDVSKTGGDTSTTKSDESKSVIIKPGMISYESMPNFNPNHPYYHPHHQMPPNIMSRHSSFNHSYYHQSQYMNGNMYPYHHHPPHHESYHNENYYDGSLKKNKSASALIPPSSHLKETESV